MLTRRARKNTIPVIILAGFLGAGKTTVLNYILHAAVGARIAVIVNDFGSANIDTLLITAQSDSKMELTNGCICCSMDGGELDEALDTAIESKPDVVIVEASGLAEPEDLARMVILSPNSMVGYGGLVYIVDAVEYETTVLKHKRVNQHIELADLVVLSKTEHVSGKKAYLLEDALSKLTKAPIVPVSNGELDPELLFDTPKHLVVQPSLLQQSNERAHRHLHDEYRSVTVECAEPLNHEKFREFMNRPVRGVYRIKGFVYFGVAGYEQKYILQSVGGRWDMYAEAWGENETPHSTLIFIGTNFSENKLREKLLKTAGEGSSMMDIHRYSAE